MSRKIRRERWNNPGRTSSLLWPASHSGQPAHLHPPARQGYRQLGLGRIYHSHGLFSFDQPLWAVLVIMTGPPLRSSVWCFTPWWAGLLSPFFPAYVSFPSLSLSLSLFPVTNPQLDWTLSDKMTAPPSLSSHWSSTPWWACLVWPSTPPPSHTQATTQN